MKKAIFYIINFLFIGIIGFSLVYYPAGDGFEGISSIWYIALIAVTVVLASALCVLELYFDYFEKFGAFILKHKKSLLNIAVAVGISAGAGALLELILSRAVFGKMSTGDYFNIYRFFFFTAAVFVVLYTVLKAKKGILKTENAFLAVSLAAGLVMIFSSPFGHTCWDTESHYIYTVREASAGGQVSAAYDSFFSVPDDYLPKETAKENAELIDRINELDKIYAGSLNNGLSVPHIPGAVALAVGRLFGLSFYAKDCLIKLVNLIFYSLLVFWGLKKLKSGKTVLSVLALLPTSLFMAANVTYDWWVNGFMILGVSCFLSEMQSPEKHLSTLDTVIMCGSLFFACFPKQIYFPVMFLPFFLNKPYFKTQKKEKRKYFIICALFILLLLLSFALRGAAEIGTGGDSRGGTGVNAGEQIAFILGSPFKYAGILIKFVWDYISLESAKHFINNFAYLGFGTGFTLGIILLVAAVFTDKNEYDALSSTPAIRTAAAVIFALGLVLVPTALYVAYTPVACDTVKGCQPRYLVPLLIPVLPLIGSKNFKNGMNSMLYRSLFTLGSAVLLFVGIYETMILKML